MNKSLWTVDERPDVNGFFTIRPADGSANGNIHEQPIATVYKAVHANQIVTLLTQRNALWDALSAILEAPERELLFPEELLNAALAAIEQCQRGEVLTPPKPIILITVEGGVVQDVCATTDDVEVIVRDLDDQSERQVSTQSFPVDTLTDERLAEIRVEIEQTDREMEEEMKA